MFVSPDCEKLQYSGRIDHTKKDAPVFVDPCSNVKTSGSFIGESSCVLG